MATAPADDRTEEARRALSRHLDSLLGSSFGASVSHWLGLHDITNPSTAGLISSLPYVVILFLGIYVLHSPIEITLLSCWAVWYVGIVVALTRHAAASAADIMNTLLIPLLSAELADDVRTRLVSEFQKKRLLRRSLAAAAISILAAILLLSLSPFWRLIPWALGYFLIFLTASLGTLTSRFYLCFGRSIKDHPDQLFPLDPAKSPIVYAATVLGSRILTHWFHVLLLVTTLLAVPLIGAALFDRGFEALRWFVPATVSVAGFFSFVFGTLGYFTLESDLRTAVDQVRLRTLTVLHEQYQRLFASVESLSEAELRQLDQLKEMHTYLSTAGSLRGAARSVGRTLVAILPAALGIITAAISLAQAR